MAESVDPLDIVTPPKVYKAVRRCIYCGRMARKLGKEHIIPFGIAANSLVLPFASCRFDGPKRHLSSCSDLTRDFETACLRRMWWPFRTKLGSPSRGKETPKSFALRRITVNAVNDDGSIRSYDRDATNFVKPHEFPLVYTAFKFPPPAALVGRDPSSDLYDLWGIANAKDFEALSLKDKEGFRISPGHPIEFSKLLAKIAHSYAVAELGYDGFDHALTHFLRGAPMRVMEWIGGDRTVAAPTTALHDIRWRIQKVKEKNFVVVDLRLFSFLGSPQYCVVVGELKHSLSGLPFLEQPLYTIDMKVPLSSGDFTPLVGETGISWS